MKSKSFGIHATRITFLVSLLATLLYAARSSPAATFTVSTTDNSGPGSLRQAIIDANATSEADTIVFNIPGPSAFTIALSSALPAITRPLTIDATTQPGFSGQPIIELNGSALQSAQSANGLRITGGNCTVRGLVINEFSGTTSAPRAGIWIESGGRNLIEGNFIGTDLTGSIAVANHYGVVILNSANNLIGGTNAAARNVISGNSVNGIHIEGGSASGNKVQGNVIGTDITGMFAVGNARFGVTIANAPNNLIGGSAAGARNIISGNSVAGVRIPFRC